MLTGKLQGEHLPQHCSAGLRLIEPVAKAAFFSAVVVVQNILPNYAKVAPPMTSMFCTIATTSVITLHQLLPPRFPQTPSPRRELDKGSC
jgi:hypothetical protein